MAYQPSSAKYYTNPSFEKTIDLLVLMVIIKTCSAEIPLYFNCYKIDRKLLPIIN